MTKFNRILVKVSGEALEGDKGHGLDEKATLSVAKQLLEITASGVEVAVVVGGGNFWRGRVSKDMDRTVADQIGMLATLMNALALHDAIRSCGGKSLLCSAVTVDKVASYNVQEARSALSTGTIVVFGGGTGSPFFSTDTAVVLRACEMNADAVFCSKAVDGVYDSDPKTNPRAKKFDEISFDKVLADNLKALDATAAALAREFGITVVCFGKDEPNGLVRILKGEKLGTIIK